MACPIPEGDTASGPLVTFRTSKHWTSLFVLVFLLQFAHVHPFVSVVPLLHANRFNRCTIAPILLARKPSKNQEEPKPVQQERRIRRRVAPEERNAYTEVFRALDSLSSQKELLKRLNPNNAAFDKVLQLQWQTLTPASRKELRDSLASGTEPSEQPKSRAARRRRKKSQQGAGNETQSGSQQQDAEPSTTAYTQKAEQGSREPASGEGDRQAEQQLRDSLASGTEPSEQPKSRAARRRRKKSQQGAGNETQSGSQQQDAEPSTTAYTQKAGSRTGSGEQGSREPSSAPNRRKGDRQAEQEEEALRGLHRMRSNAEDEMQGIGRVLETEIGDAAFEEQVDEFKAVRKLLGGSESAEETRRLEGVASVFGLDSPDALAEQFASLLEVSVEEARESLIVVAERVSSQAASMNLNDTAMPDVFEVMRNNSSPFGPGYSLPNTSGFPPNDEVDAYHELSRAKALELEKDRHKFNFVNFNRQQPPTGNMLTGASLEELSSATLDQLWWGAPGTKWASTHAMKIELTVVGSGFLFRAATAVVADKSGQHVRLAVYGTAAQCSRDAEQLLPVGARFVLKQPWLKRAADQWLSLRVERPETLVRLDVAMVGNILVLGDGDFSLSRALAERNSLHGAASITATSLDSKKAVEAKYAGAGSNLASHAALESVTVAHGIDATNLPASLQRAGLQTRKFDAVLWNFPYPVEVKTAKANLGRSLAHEFFRSVEGVLEEKGEVRIALARRQGGSTREARSEGPSWMVEVAAAAAGFDLAEVVPFNASLFGGYSPRREYTDASFPYEQVRVHIFRRRSAEADASGSDSRRRHFAATSGQLLHHLARPRGSTPQGTGPPLAAAAFAPYAASSAVARSMVEAAEQFERAAALAATFRNEPEPYEEVARWFASEQPRSPADEPAPVQVVRLLEDAYATSHGELVATWDDASVLGSALLCTAMVARSAMAQACSPISRSPSELVELEAFRRGLVEEPIEMVLDRAARLHIATPGFMRRGVWFAPFMSADGVSLLASSLFVRCMLTLHCVTPGQSLNAARAACHSGLLRAIAMGISHAPTYRMSAALFGFVANEVDEKSEMHAQALACMLEHSDAALEMDANYADALYSKAFALRSSGNFSAAVACYERYLGLVDPDDRMRPDAHYHAGMLTSLEVAKSAPGAQREIMARAREHYQRGAEAEERPLPGFPPVGSNPSKSLLSLALQAYSGYTMANEARRGFGDLQAKLSGWLGRFRKGDAGGAMKKGRGKPRKRQRKQR